jgi:hypothetical protein
MIGNVAIIFSGFAIMKGKIAKMKGKPDINNGNVPITNDKAGDRKGIIVCFPESCKFKIRKNQVIMN